MTRVEAGVRPHDLRECWGEIEAFFDEIQADPSQGIPFTTDDGDVATFYSRQFSNTHRVMAVVLTPENVCLPVRRLSFSMQGRNVEASESLISRRSQQVVSNKAMTMNDFGTLVKLVESEDPRQVLPDLFACYL